MTIVNWVGYLDGAIEHDDEIVKIERTADGNLWVTMADGVYNVHPKAYRCYHGDVVIENPFGVWPIRWKE